MYARLRVIAGPNRGEECVTNQSEISVAVDAEKKVHFNPTAQSGTYEKQGKVFFHSNAWHLQISKGLPWFLDGKRVSDEENAKLKSGSIVRFSAFGPDLRFEISLQPFLTVPTTASPAAVPPATSPRAAGTKGDAMFSHHYEMIDSLLEADAARDTGDAGSAIWYVAHSSGAQFGPANSKVLQAWIAEGRVGADSLVWKEGWEEWRPASVVMNVSRAAAAPAASAATSATAVAKTEVVNGSVAANALSRAAGATVPNSASTDNVESNKTFAIRQFLRQTLAIVKAVCLVPMRVGGRLYAGIFSTQEKADSRSTQQNSVRSRDLTKKRGK